MAVRFLKNPNRTQRFFASVSNLCSPQRELEDEWGEAPLGVCVLDTDTEPAWVGVGSGNGGVRGPGDSGWQAAVRGRTPGLASLLGGGGAGGGRRVSLSGHQKLVCSKHQAHLVHHPLPHTPPRDHGHQGVRPGLRESLTTCCVARAAPVTVATRRCCVIITLNVSPPTGVSSGKWAVAVSPTAASPEPGVEPDT